MRSRHCFTLRGLGICSPWPPLAPRFIAPDGLAHPMIWYANVQRFGRPRVRQVREAYVARPIMEDDHDDRREVHHFV